MTTPLSYSQQGVYIDCTLNPEKLNYNIPYCLTFPQSVNAEEVANAVKQVLECHPSLFSIFRNQEGETVQVFPNEYKAEVKIISVAEENLYKAKESFVRSFDIEHGPLYRAEVLYTSTTVKLFIDIHHLVCDGTSMNLLLQEICHTLEGVSPKTETLNYKAFIEAQRKTPIESHKSYYDNLMTETEPTAMPADRNESEGYHDEVCLPISCRDVITRAKALGTAPSALFMAATFYTLGRYANTKNVCMTTISNGRRNALTQGMVGMFVNTLPLVSKIEDISVKEYICKTRDMFVSTREHEEYPFSSIVSDYNLKPKSRFAYQYGTYKPLCVAGEDVVRERMRTNDHDNPFTVTINSVDGCPAIVINYDTKLYSEDLIKRFAESMDAVINHFITEPDARLLSTSIMSNRQHSEVEALHETCLDLSAVRFSLFHKSVEYWAEQTPETPAVIACNETLTYREFNEKANILAHALIGKGVVPGDRICLLLPRKSWHLIAMFGVMKAGAAYIPCDPEYPAERIKLITEDSNARYIITTRYKMESYGERALNIENLLEIKCKDVINTDNPEVQGITPEMLAYLIYTSGSTGRPKGVMLRHIGICNYLTNHKENRHIHAMVNNCKTMLCITTVSFDLSLKELGASLFNGLTLVMANEEQVNDPLALADLMLSTGVDGFSGTPSRLKMFLDLPDFQKALCKCKYIVLGGEKYPPTLLPQIKELAPGARLFNTYGPTEISVSSNGKELTHANHITIGRPLLNVQEYIVDTDFNELPVGVTGELIIGGLGVSAGYNNLPEKTAEAFVDYQDKRCYKSGDYAYWNSEGEVIILGRKDHQIKLNGLRIELGEVETVLNNQSQVNEGVVVIKTVNGHDHLVAYYTSNENVEEKTIKEQMSSSLTDYMVPTIFMQLDKMPISPNGKTDLKALPEPIVKEDETEYSAPRELNFLEKKLTELVADILAIDSVSVTTPLRRSGLTSLLSIKLAAQLYKEFGIKFKIKELSEGNVLNIENTILESVFRQKSTTENTETISNNTTPKIATFGKFPLSYPQQGVYLDIMRNPDSVQYNMPKCLEFPVEYSSEQIAEAVRKVIKNHPILSAHFESDGETVMQVIPEDIVPVVSISNEKPELLKANFIRPFNLEHGPLYRATVIGSTLLLDTLHLVNDGASAGIIQSEICKALQGEDLTPESYTYLNYVVDEQRARKSMDFADSKAFFDERMKTIDEASSIQADVNRGENYKGHLCYTSTPFDMKAVSDFTRQLGITPAALFLAAANYTVARYTGSDDVCIATISNGRSNVMVSDTVGMFVNTLALTSHLKDQTVEKFILATADEYSQTLEHENYPFAELSADYDFHPDIFYQYQIGVNGRMMIGDKEVKRSVIGNTDPKFKMIISIEADTDNKGRIEMQYNDAFYSEQLASGLSLSMANVLSNMMADISAPVRKVSMLNASQKVQIESFHDGPHAEIPIKLYHKLLEASVAAHHESMALVAVDQQLTYGEMNAQMNRIANALIARGIKRGDRIALLLPRTSRLILSQFGVLKTGSAYIPCDPKYPTERIKHILDDSASPLIITTSDHLAEFPGRSVDIEELLKFKDSNAEQNPDIHVEPDDLAYLIYTSGSTGVPKGVQLMHKGVCNYHCATNLVQRMLNSECHAALGITTISFDMSVWETGSPLMLGKTLVLASDEQCNDPQALANLIEKYDIGCMTATTSRFMQLFESEDFERAFRSHIRMAYQGGEGMSKALLDKLQGYGVRIINGYGPTETIANSHASELTSSSIPHIGKPCCNYNNYIVDNDGNELPVGVVGELLIGGDSVARGYNNLPEQTEARFKINPFKNDGSRIYHSGDYARWLADGNVMVLGRKDNQVKLRGLRIELGEVESAMIKVEGIKNTVVMIKKLQGRDHLCAYFTADRHIDIEELKAELKKTLTHYMIPTAYLQMEAFPLTPNGKTNTKVLPEPVVAVAQTEQVAAANKTEQDFCDIFAEVLEQDKVGATDNFFEIGGTSLVAMRVVMRAVKAGYKIVYKDVFENPTPRNLATLLGESIEASDAKNVINTISTANIKSLAPLGTPDDPEIHDYDYSRINELLKNNTTTQFVQSDWRNNLRGLGTCIVTGATGYLGIHIVKELIERDDVTAIYCMVRGAQTMTAESRLRTQLFYYFGNTYNELFGSRLFVIDGDVTKPNCLDTVADISSSNLTLFNCAANVKHFSAGTDIEDINIGGCQTCIDFCLNTGARLIQTSTHSIEGRMIGDQPVSARTLTESTLYYGQTQSGQYTRSKFIAERNVLESIIDKGLDGKIMRYGNLAARSTDGEFQINFGSNGFMSRLNVYRTLGAIPYSINAGLTEFSPINEVAHATVLLATLPREYTVFMPINSHHEPMSDIITCMNRLGYSIRNVEQNEFDNIVLEAGQDKDKASILQSLLGYASNIRGKYIARNDRKYDFTTQVLMRMGFEWSFTTWDYMERMISAISGLGFFDEDYVR